MINTNHYTVQCCTHRILYALRGARWSSSLLNACLLAWRPNRPMYGTAWTTMPHLLGKQTPIRGRDAIWEVLLYNNRGMWFVNVLWVHRGKNCAETYKPRPDCGTVTTRKSVPRPFQYRRTTHYRRRMTDSPGPLQQRGESTPDLKSTRQSRDFCVKSIIRWCWCVTLLEMILVGYRNTSAVIRHIFYILPYTE